VTDVRLDPVHIDVGQVLGRTMTSLYSHLVTRATGRAVRVAIEARLRAAGPRSLSLIDLSEVVILDFSCADEVVARLVEDSVRSSSYEAFFVFLGVHEPHRDQVETVLERRGLAAVVETHPGTYRLAGRRSEREEVVWTELERCGLVGPEELARLAPDPEHADALASLLQRRLAFRSPASGRVHALSQLAGKFG
jgi:hypothetical protein